MIKLGNINETIVTTSQFKLVLKSILPIRYKSLTFFDNAKEFVNDIVRWLILKAEFYIKFLDSFIYDFQNIDSFWNRVRV